MTRIRALIVAMALCLAFFLNLPLALGQEEAEEVNVAPMVISIAIEPGEDRYVIPKITGASTRAVQTALGDYIVQPVNLNDTPLPGENHVWLAGADSQARCTDEPRSLEYLQVAVDLIRDDIDNFVEGGVAKLDRLLGVTPCLNEFVNAETLARVRLLQGIGSLFYREDVEAARRYYRDALVGAVIPWDDNYDPDQFAGEFNRIERELGNWRRDDSPFWVPVHLALDAQEVRIDGRENVTRVLPGEHLIQWRNAEGEVEGRLFTIAADLSGTNLAEDVRAMEERGETGIVALDAEHWRSTLENQNFDALFDRIVLRATFGELSRDGAAAVISVQPSGPLGLVWRRSGDPEFQQLDLSEVEELIPEQAENSGGEERQVQFRRIPVYGGFSTVGGARWVGAASYGDIELGGHLNPAAGVWLDLTVGLGITLWEPPNASSRNVILPTVGLGGRYVFQTPWILPRNRGLEFYLRPYVGGRALMVAIHDDKVGGGGIAVAGLEIRPSSGGKPSPLWIRIEGYGGAISALDAAWPVAGIRGGFAFHDAWKRTAPTSSSD